MPRAIVTSTYRSKRPPRKKAKASAPTGPRDDWSRSVVRVGSGRGFVVQTEREHRFIVTAGHCLPHLPPCHGASYLDERTYKELIGPLGAAPAVWAECVFIDPVSDLAVLCSPDNQEFFKQAEDYEALVEAAFSLPIGSLAFARKPVTLPDGTTFLQPPRADAEAWLMSLDGQWFSCRVQSGGRALWIAGAVAPIRGGMSGSPIMSPEGAAIGVVCNSSGGSFDHHGGGPNPELAAHLPAWILPTLGRGPSSST